MKTRALRGTRVPAQLAGSRGSVRVPARQLPASRRHLSLRLRAAHRSHACRPGTIVSTFCAKSFSSFSLWFTLGICSSFRPFSGVPGSLQGYNGAGEIAGNDCVMYINFECILSAMGTIFFGRGVDSSKANRAALSEPKYLTRCTGSPRAACLFLVSTTALRIACGNQRQHVILYGV